MSGETRCTLIVLMTLILCATVCIVYPVHRYWNWHDAALQQCDQLTRDGNNLLWKKLPTHGAGKETDK